MPTLELVTPYNLQQTTNKDGRVYVTPEGNRYPSVTTVLSQRGKEFLEEWRQRVGEEEAARISRQSSNIGNRVHVLCEDYLYGREILYPDPGTKMVFNAMRRHLARIETVRAIETPLWSDYLKVAGRTDCVGIYDDELSIIDFKNSRQPKKPEWVENYFIQGACYARMFYDVYKIPVKQIVIIVGVWNGESQVFKVRVKDWWDETIRTMQEYNPLWQ